MTSIPWSMSGWISDQVQINDMCCQIQLIINSNYCIKYDSHAYIVYVKNKYKKMCRQPKGYQYQISVVFHQTSLLAIMFSVAKWNDAHKTSLAIGSCLLMFFNNQTFFARVLTSASAYWLPLPLFSRGFAQLGFLSGNCNHSLFGCRAHHIGCEKFLF